MEEANNFLSDNFIKKHNSTFMVKASMEGTAFVPLGGVNVNDILCIQEQRIVNNDNTIRYKNKIIQIFPQNVNLSYVHNTVLVHEYVDGSLAVFHGPRKLPASILAQEE